ncbi:hypothetical protein GUY44_11905 [Pimelobacter simplex]|uniref:hypothetical protein n=1 Tax=Nocardioides simplex TaxID=2045 RepID=UPI0005363B54|nr:hypothetical protein [Pimelobacter simplex]MCG8151186.1 hypothetical protein [Pimelobacter simplex]GEB17221.1 hypothetical protein NSI01_55360 [Pimelobacter simplex]SFN18634.1 hypothetical protein SAMN05421671_0002 [Pimelobacter simplex]
MNDEFRLPIAALCVAACAGLIWIATRSNDISGVFALIAVVAGLCGFAGLAMAVMSSDEKE